MSEQTSREATATESGSESGSRRRTGAGHAVTNWLLVEGNRLVIAGGVLGGVLAALLAVEWAYGFVTVRAASPIYFLFSSLLTGDLTLVTVVLSINQLVLSRELGAPGTLSERLQGAVDYRDEVAESTGASVTPKTPARFLRYLHGEVESRTHRVEEAAADVTDDSLRERLDELTASLFDDVALVNRTLEADEGIFTVVSATIATNHADQLRTIAGVRADCADSLSEDLDDLLEGLETQLLQIDVARNYFKTVYVQKELAYLSRVLLYVGVPAIVASGLALVFYNAVGPASVPSAVVYAVVAVTFTLGFAPLAVLFAFVLRLAWVAQRTASVAPFASERYP
ncbi:MULTISPECIES: hypothetical protein [Halorussus]|uniref:hypothetical protein n=1 Tax=Halorussus TaxID=1070314 RepID=UPI000E214576|nr:MULTISPECIES: hypothetical protein [Halorussus]NHN58810.1 hypothetical protein [Halorussus sp. JP-T4]